MNVKKVTALITSFLELTHSVAKEESEKLAKNTGAYSRTKSEKISLEDFIMASVLRCGVTLSDLALNYFGPGMLRPSASAFSQAKRKTPLLLFVTLYRSNFGKNIRIFCFGPLTLVKTILVFFLFLFCTRFLNQVI